MTRRIGLAIMMTAIPAMAGADDSYIRLESWRDPAAASASAERWAERFSDVVTYPAGSWHAVALGPVDEGDAPARLSDLKAEGAIPRDAVIAVPDEATTITPVTGNAADDADMPAADIPADASGTPASAASTAAIFAPDDLADGAAVDEPDAEDGTNSAEDAAPSADANAADTRPAAAHISIEAYRDRATAESALTRWQAQLPEASLWALDSGWYAIAAGPYEAEEAESRLADLKRQGRIPSDAFLSGEGALGTQLIAAEDMAAPADTDPGSTAESPAETESEPESEAAAPPPQMPPLDIVQEALLWAGHYEGEIDGRPGPMTSAAIRAELDRQGIDPAQPDAEAIAMTALLAERMAWRDEIGLDRLEDSFTGISLTVPVPRLDFLRTDRNLSIYGPRDGSGAALILFNQEGGRTEMLDLAGLITALGWVPNPVRDIGSDRFRLDGGDDLHIGHAEATLTDGRVQGFVLIWPQADAANAPRLVREAAASFTVTNPATPATSPAASADESEAAE